MYFKIGRLLSNLNWDVHLLSSPSPHRFMTTIQVLRISDPRRLRHHPPFIAAPSNWLSSAIANDWQLVVL